MAHELKKNRHHKEFSEAAINNIRTRYAKGEASQRALASEYGVHLKAIYSIIHYKAYAYIDIPYDTYKYDVACRSNKPK